MSILDADSKAHITAGEHSGIFRIVGVDSQTKLITGANLDRFSGNDRIIAGIVLHTVNTGGNVAQTVVPIAITHGDSQSAANICNPSIEVADFIECCYSCSVGAHLQSRRIGAAAFRELTNHAISRFNARLVGNTDRCAGESRLGIDVRNENLAIHRRIIHVLVLDGEIALAGNQQVKTAALNSDSCKRTGRDGNFRHGFSVDDFCTNGCKCGSCQRYYKCQCDRYANQFLQHRIFSF